MTTRWGGFFDDVDHFGSAFFGISPREAQRMDPHLLGGRSVMPPDLALAALQQALDQDERPLVVADTDWTRFAPSFAASRSRPLPRDLAVTAPVQGDLNNIPAVLCTDHEVTTSFSYFEKFEGGSPRSSSPSPCSPVPPSCCPG